MRNLIIFTVLLLISNLLYSNEDFKIDLQDKDDWKVLTDQKLEQFHIIEMIPVDEKINNWTILINLMTMDEIQNIPMRKAMDMMSAQIKENSPDATISLIEINENADYPWILFKSENPNAKGDMIHESQLWYIIQGKNALYVNFVAKKENILSDAFIEKWSKVFKSSKLVGSK